MNKNDFLEYICAILNIKSDNVIVMEDVLDELETVGDIVEFRNFIKLHVANLNNDTKFLTGFQKFIHLSSEFKKKQLALSFSEYDEIAEFCDGLHSKLTDYFERLRDLYITREQLKHQIWKTQKMADGSDMINKEESVVCDLIGDTNEIYNLAVFKKQELKDKISEIKYQLTTESKKASLKIGYNNQKRIN